jgi:hypothetical protein
MATFKRKRALASPDISTGDANEDVSLPPPSARAPINGQDANRIEENNINNQLSTRPIDILPTDDR